MLTGLANRRHAALSLETAVASAKRYGTTLSVALLDIDHFKQVNDVHGHAGGDAALRHIGALLKRTSRRADLVARWGGEEFFAILPGAAEAGARIAGERIRALIAKSPVELASGPLTITTSIGLATWDDHSAEELIDHADKALYAAKRSGRNRVEVWRSDIADEK
jgi:diguanylate cyclase (GGDEF)-like protein